MPIVPDRSERRELRNRLRLERRRLDRVERELGEAAICSQIRNLGAFRRARHIGTYFAFDGEPDLHPLLKHGATSGKQFYAPVIDDDHMRFAPVSDIASMRRNRFGILEPRSGRPFEPRKLDLVLTPLVAFDESGARIGVGRGYYDRCFAFLARRKRWQHPKLLGIAYSFQNAGAIVTGSWDIPLWGVVTERYLRVFGGD